MIARQRKCTYPRFYVFACIGAVNSVDGKHGTAIGMAQAFDRMRGWQIPSTERLQAALRNASDHSGRWPRISTWHGDADSTVSVSNADAILAQWLGVYQLTPNPTIVDRIDQVPRRAWHGRDGSVLVEDYIIPGMGHGTPLKTSGAGAYGSSAPYMLDVGISSTFRIARFWGIADAEPDEVTEPRETVVQATIPLRRWEPAPPYGQAVKSEAAHAPSGVGKVIEDALRAAGLMK